MSILNKINIYILTYIFLLIFFVIVISCSSESKEDDSYEVTVDKVYGNGSKYCAFTSLVKRGAFYYLAFREADSHVGEGDYGIIIILRSKDAKYWEQYQILDAENVDLRDPNLSVTPNGRLLLLCGARIHHPDGYYYTKSYYAIENDKAFSEVQPLNIPAEIDDPYCCWLWKLTWMGTHGYGAAYRNDGISNKLTLLSTTDGINYAVVADISADRVINETSIAILPNNEMIALFRSDREGYICHSLPPYTEWNLKKINIYLAGHDLIISGNQLICATRLATNIGERTALWFGDLEGNFQWSYILPSSGVGGGTAYSGIIEEKEKLLISYYSMHQAAKPSIYLATIPKVNLPLYK